MIVSKRLCIGLACWAAATLFSPSAEAATVSYFFTAEKFTEQGDPDGLAGFTLPETISGALTFDDAQAPFSSVGTSSATYQASLTLDFGPAQLTDHGGNLLVRDFTTSGTDQIAFGAGPTTLSNGASVQSVSMFLLATGPTYWDSTALPTLAQVQGLTGDLLDFVSIVFTPNQIGDLQSNVQYRDFVFSDSPAAAPVPLPAAGFLLLGAFAGLAALRRPGQKLG